MKYSQTEIELADFVLAMTKAQRQWVLDVINFDDTREHDVDFRVWQLLANARILQIPQRTALHLVRRRAQLKRWLIEDGEIRYIADEITKGPQMAEKAPAEPTERVESRPEGSGFDLGSLAGLATFGDGKPKFVASPQPPNPEESIPAVEADGGDVQHP